MLHINIHTPDASIHAKMRDGGLGIMELRSKIPRILLKRLVCIRENNNDQIGQRMTYSTDIDKLMRKLPNLAGEVSPEQVWTLPTQQPASHG